MNWDRADTVAPDYAFAPPATVPQRILRLLLRAPAELRSQKAGAIASLLAIAGAAAGIWAGVLHLQLWSDGYRDIPVIGALFLLQGAGSIVIALVLALFRRLVLMAAGAVALAATAGSLLLSAGSGLFGFRESLAVPYATESLVAEFTGAALLVAAMVLMLAAPTARAAGYSDSRSAAPPGKNGKNVPAPAPADEHTGNLS